MEPKSADHPPVPPPAQVRPRALSPPVLRRSILVGVVALLLAAGVALGFSQLLAQIERRQAEHAIELAADSAAFAVRKSIYDYTRMIDRMANRWVRRGGTPRAEWEADAELLTRHLPGMQAVEWADPDMVVRWLAPVRGNEGVEGLDLSFEERRLTALQQARAERRPTMTATIELVQGGAGIIYCVPLYTEAGFEGYILGVIRVQQLVRRELGGMLSDYTVDIRDASNQVYINRDPAVDGLASLEAERLVNMDFLSWRVRLVMNPARVAEMHGQSEMARNLGLALALLLALVAGMITSIRGQDRELREANAQLQLQLHRSLQARASELESTNAQLKDMNVGLSREIREREAAQQALAAAERRWRETIELAPFPIMVHAQDGEILSVNQAWILSSGFSTEQIDSLGAWMRLAHGFDDQQVNTHTTQLYRRDTFMHEGERQVRRADGSIRTWEFHSAPLGNLADGRRTVIYIAVDVTERLEQERELQDLNRDLQRSNSELEQFAYVASHDLQEPLRMVSSYLQLLQSRYKDKLDADAHEFIEFAVDGATRMQLLINNLLQYSRITTRGMEFEPVDANVTLAQALRDLEWQIGDCGAQVTYDSLPTVKADPVQLKQIFQNLISNAIKFVDKAAPKVHVGVKIRGAMAEFRVTDNGIGIDPAHFEKIFKIFQRLHSRKSYAGTGIGLSICQRIAERHGGRIRVESEVGKGSTFAFTIPLQADREPGDT